MFRGFYTALLLAVVSSAFAAKKRPDVPMPDQFELGRHTFFDFGPPFDYYEVFVVRPSSAGSFVERITLTPPANKCTQPAKLEAAVATLNQSVADLLVGVNPCSIPQKELSRELKRRKKYLVFSGANVSMQAECGGQKRIIRADILDRDMFDAHPETPERTSWTMGLLGRLDKSLEPGVMDKPVFAVASGSESKKVDLDRQIERDLAAGAFDQLFQGAPDKPSDLFKAAQIQSPPPGVRLISSSPVAPLQFVAPKYPPMARLANVSGNVNVTLVVGMDGKATQVVFKDGSPLLRGATEDAARSWKFPIGAAGKAVEAKIEFNSNCEK